MPGHKGALDIYNDDQWGERVASPDSIVSDDLSVLSNTSISDSDDEVNEILVERGRPWVALPPTYNSKPALRVFSKPRPGKQDLRASYMSGAVFGDENWDELQPQALPPKSYECPTCKALFRPTEINTVENLPNREKQNRKSGGAHFTYRCCNGGTINFTEANAFKEPSSTIKALYEDTSPLSKNFKQNIIAYNRMFSTVQFLYRQIKRPQKTKMEVLNVNGQVTYRPNSFAVDELTPGQVYFVDEENDPVSLRMATANLEKSELLSEDIVEMFENYLQENNRFVQCFKTAREVMHEEDVRARATGSEVREVTLAINPRPSERSGYRVAMETVQERMLKNADATIRPCRDFIAAVFVGNFTDINYDTFFRPRQGKEGEGFPGLSGNEVTIDIMNYPLIHLHGEQSWTQSDDRDKADTFLRYYRYRIMRRRSHYSGEFSPLFNIGKLFSQYLLDAAIKIETSRLSFYANNQKQLKATKMATLRNYIKSEAAKMGKGVGRFVVLPKDFVHGIRYRQDRFLNGMALARHFGCPSFFITMTCNPKWKEIEEELLKPQWTWQDMPDIVVSVFKDKLRHLLSDIISNQIFGRVLAYFTSDEFQKGSLPHCHILIILHPGDRPSSGEDVDRIISAELPKPSHPVFPLVVEHMLHHRCDEWTKSKKPGCFANGRSCRFKFPKQFSKHTDMDTRRVQYRRRKNGRKALKDGVAYDNRSVVPHNIYLLLRYKCHINVEFVKSTLRGFKYMCVYVNKSPDSAYVSLIDKNRRSKAKNIEWDEIEHYKQMRYLCPTEAAYRILGLSFGEISHVVIPLPVHLPDEQPVVFQEGEEVQAVSQDDDSRLLAWFKHNALNKDSRHLMYADFPSEYTWTKKKTWQKRQKGQSVGRLSIVTPNDKNMERFYLRLLLLNVPGAVSYEHLRTVNNVVCTTNEEACSLLGLIETDNYAFLALAEMCVHAFPNQIRMHFCLLLVHSLPKNPLQLWDEFKEFMSEDYAHKTGETEVTEVHHNMALLEIQSILNTMRRELCDFGLPAVQLSLVKSYEHQIDVVSDDLTTFTKEEATADYVTLNKGQKQAFDYILGKINNPDEEDNLIFLSASGGCGKTYLYNCIIKHLRSIAVFVVACAYTGIAAQLLIDAITSHQLFGFPLNPKPGTIPTSTIETQTRRADILREARVILWDEISMASAWEVDVADQFLRKLCKIDKPFAGKVVVFGGDFKQVLPVVKKGGRRDILAESLIASPLWERLQVIELTLNMRAACDQNFAEWLLGVGDGSANIKGTSRIDLRHENFAEDLDTLVNNVYGSGVPSARENAVILTPKNDTMRDVNSRVYERLPAEASSYLSSNSFVADHKKQLNFADQRILITQEMLQDLDQANLPSHRLQVKPGCVVMLLCNLRVKSGLCNGTRLEVLEPRDHTIKCKILSGQKVGDIVWLFRVKLNRDDTELPGTLTRVQFPIRLAYCITINKSQGSTFDLVGLYLPVPCFTHGQLYVASSRGKMSKNVFICVKKGSEQGFVKRSGKLVHFFTRNEVFREVIHAIKYHPRKINLA